MNWQLYNVILSGTCFVLIFTAFYAASGSAKKQDQQDIITFVFLRYTAFWSYSYSGKYSQG